MKKKKVVHLMEHFHQNISTKNQKTRKKIKKVKSVKKRKKRMLGKMKERKKYWRMKEKL